ncbi:hypothetical protein MRS44_001385 [Fusarium solani]|uniref:uncharacterized protein n=1 Tax=Fusarium solani TaxID=169388 RepID=UPI0032C429B0|nr:hypothetical protein MRS44_001385 [Fusarium solani]
MDGTSSVRSETRRVLSRVNRPAHRRNQGLPGHAIVVLDRHLDTRRGPTRGGDPDPGQAWHAAAASRGSDSAPPRSISPTLTPPKEQRGAPRSPQHLIASTYGYIAAARLPESASSTLLGHHGTSSVVSTGAAGLQVDGAIEGIPLLPDLT